jgi:N-methylhydantoinase B
MPSSRSLDPIRFEVIRNALVEATEEMAAALRRSAYSTNIKTRGDCSCALFDRRLRLVAQAFSQPNLLGSLVELVPKAVEVYGADRLGPGDAILVNDPYLVAPITSTSAAARRPAWAPSARCFRKA